MTIDSTIGVAKRIEVRMVFEYLAQTDALDRPYPLSIGHAVDLLQGVEDLVYLCSIANWEARAKPPTALDPDTFIANVIVKRISYASPMEVVVWFLSGTPLATLAANRLINVWTNFQNARRVTAETDLFIAAANVLQGSIEAPTPVISPETPGYDRFHRASQILVQLGSVEVQEEA